MAYNIIRYFALIGTIINALSTQSFAAQSHGEMKGHAIEHNAETIKALVANASVALPAQVVGTDRFIGKFDQIPEHIISKKVPVVLFLHGSSGLGLKAIGDWQAWLADLGIASVAPDSFVLPDRITYTSPVDKITYEKIHTLRQSEIAATLKVLLRTQWVDTNKLILAGASEGGVPVARNQDKWLGRMIFSWSCENNYFVTEHRTYNMTEPVLNVMSSTDPFFSTENSWLDNAAATGNCAKTLKQNPQATIVLIPGAPHTLLNLPPVRMVTQAWLERLLSGKP